jgi:ferric-dicitrate binding protein FerR (iron transport regulator)
MGRESDKRRGISALTSIKRQATQWLVRMDGDDPLSNAEKEALTEWMSRSALHRAELRRIAQFWEHANILTELIAGLESQGHQRTRRRYGGRR